MNSQYRSAFDLRPFSEFLSNRETQIPKLINSLKIKDVETDESYNATVTRILNKVSVELVEFGEFKHIDFEYETRNLSFTQQAAGMSRDVYTHELSIPFTGSRELFLFYPNSFGVGSSDRGVLSPGHNSVTIYVDRADADPDQAKADAQSNFALTKKLVTSNNDEARNWNQRIEVQIRQSLDNKRQELIKLFGKK